MRRAVSGNPDVLDYAPHFEEMLYDNSQLARVYLHARQLTSNGFLVTITEEILDCSACTENVQLSCGRDICIAMPCWWILG